MDREPGFRPLPTLLAPALCALGFGLLATPWLLAAAIGVECLFAAFWLAARAADDAQTQLHRWEWLRRPATALWIAVAARELVRATTADGIALGSYGLGFVTWLAQFAVVWAGLDLLGALPGARTFSDRTGPLAGGRFRMPALLPAAGALVFLRHTSPAPVTLAGLDWAQVVLLIAALISVLRAFGRKSWTRALRWLLVTESALAGLLASVGAIQVPVAMALWGGACGGLAMWLVFEHRGAALRRDPRLIHLWRLAGWLSTTLLAAPLIVSYLHGLHRHYVMAAGTMLVAALVAWVVVRRPQAAPERRSMTRRSSVLPLNVTVALVSLLLPLVALGAAWSWGYRAPLLWAAVALAPGVLGGALAMWSSMPAPRVAVRTFARGLFHTVARVELQLVMRAGGIGRWMVSPLRDLHSGDAQEYLLFLVGLSVLMLLLPILK